MKAQTGVERRKEASPSPHDQYLGKKHCFFPNFFDMAFCGLFGVKFLFIYV